MLGVEREQFAEYGVLGAQVDLILGAGRGWRRPVGSWPGRADWGRLGDLWLLDCGPQSALPCWHMPRKEAVSARVLRNCARYDGVTLTWTESQMRRHRYRLLSQSGGRFVAGGDTKTKKSRRTLAIPQRCVDALLARWAHRQRQHTERAQCDCLVFVSQVGTALDAHNVRRTFRKVVGAAGLTSKEWTPRELRHSFVSLLSDDGMPIEHIARLVGHTSTAVTETVYRQQIRPVIIEGAEAMDRIFRAKD